MWLLLISILSNFNISLYFSSPKKILPLSPQNQATLWYNIVSQHIPVNELGRHKCNECNAIINVHRSIVPLAMWVLPLPYINVIHCWTYGRKIHLNWLCICVFFSLLMDRIALRRLIEDLRSLVEKSNTPLKETRLEEINNPKVSIKYPLSKK